MKIDILILISIFLISGCSSLAENYLPENVIKQSSISGGYITEDGEIDLSKVSIKDFSGSNNYDKRNELIAKAMSLSDQKCTLHKAGILSNANAWNVGAGTAAILFAGTASVIQHAQTAADLAAGAAATTGVQAIVNKEVYADALGTTILRSIDVVRAKNKAVLETGMNNPNYSMSIALVDIQEYHNSCSLMAGLVEVTKAFDNRKPSRNEIQRDIDILKREIENIAITLDGVDGDIQESVLNKYAEELKEKVLQLSSSPE